MIYAAYERCTLNTEDNRLLLRNNSFNWTKLSSAEKHFCYLQIDNSTDDCAAIEMASRDSCLLEQINIVNRSKQIKWHVCLYDITLHNVCLHLLSWDNNILLMLFAFPLSVWFEFTSNNSDFCVKWMNIVCCDPLIHEFQARYQFKCLTSGHFCTQNGIFSHW